MDYTVEILPLALIRGDENRFSSKEQFCYNMRLVVLDGEVIIVVVEISYFDNAYQLNNKEDISQLYSTVVEFSYYGYDPITKKKQRLSQK